MPIKHEYSKEVVFVIANSSGYMVSLAEAQSVQPKDLQKLKRTDIIGDLSIDESVLI